MAADGTTAPAIDLATIATPEGLAAALDQLRRRAGISSKRAITTRADNIGEVLPKSTVDDALSGRRVPTVETLRAFLTVCEVTDQAQVQAWEQAAERARRGDTDRPAGAVRVQAANPRLLGVHTAIQVPGATGELPAYVPRDLDQENPAGVRVRLRTAAIRGGFVLLVGASSVGKTRCAYEALQTLLPDWWLVHPDPDQPAALAALGADPPARTVIWLDELQTYLDRDQGLTAATVRALLQGPAPVVLVGTLWPHWYATWTTPPSPDQSDAHSRQREVLGLAQVVHVPDEFSAAENDRAIQFAATDARLKAALDVKDYGLTQTLAAAPQLVDRWESAGAYARAVLAAAVDATRLGVRSPLSPALLRAAAPGYCTPTQQATAPPNWFETALAYATEPLHGATAALTPIGSGMGVLAGYTVTDYLLQHATAQRRYERVPAMTWDALLTHVHDLGDIARLAGSANVRLLYSYALPLYRRAADTGNELAAEDLAELLAGQGRVEDLRALADNGNRPAAFEQAELLATRGRLEDLRILADNGNEWAAMRLAQLLAAQDRVQDALAILRPLADNGVDWAIEDLVEVLTTRGRVEDAIAFLQDRADTGDQWVIRRLAWLLAEHDRVPDAINILRSLADAGDPGAAVELAELLITQGHVQGAIDILQPLAETDASMSWWAARRVAALLAQQGRIEDLLARAEAGDDFSFMQVAEVLAEHDRVESAMDILRSLADAGNERGASRLAEVLAQQGRIEDLRTLADTGDKSAAMQLAKMLAEHDRVQAAIDVLRSLADTGDREAAEQLAELLAKQGRINDLRAEMNAGRSHAARHLINLIELEQPDQAERMRRFGLNPDGSIADGPDKMP